MTEDTVAQVHDIIQPCTYSGNDKIVAWYAEFCLYGHASYTNTGYRLICYMLPGVMLAS